MVEQPNETASHPKQAAIEDLGAAQRLDKESRQCAFSSPPKALQLVAMIVLLNLD